MAKRISFIVHGRVQGVGFRYFTRRTANEYGLTGWVRNTVDQKVEGEAQGPETVIESFITALKTGPRHSEVTKFEYSDVDTVDGETVFEVRR